MIVRMRAKLKVIHHRMMKITLKQTQMVNILGIRSISMKLMSYQHKKMVIAKQSIQVYTLDMMRTETVFLPPNRRVCLFHRIRIHNENVIHNKRTLHYGSIIVDTDC